MGDVTTHIRKTANKFRVGEVMYLYGCDTGDLYGVLQGSFLIDEIKHQSDTGVSFFLSPYVLPAEPLCDLRLGHDTYLVEFARNQMLTRISGPVVSYVIEAA